MIEEQNTAPTTEEVNSTEGQLDTSNPTWEETIEEGQAETNLDWNDWSTIDAPDSGQADVLDTWTDEIDYKAEYEKVNWSYWELRSKFDKSTWEYSQQIKDLQEEMKAYQDFYNDNNKLLSEVTKDEALLEQLNSKIWPEYLSKEEADQRIVDKMEEQFRIQQNVSDFGIKYNKWENDNKDVPQSVLDTVSESLKSVNIDWLDNDQIIQIMDEKLAYHQAKHQKALWAKEEQLRQKKVSDASVWWNTNIPNDSTQQNNPFAAPMWFDNWLF